MDILKTCEHLQSLLTTEEQKDFLETINNWIEPVHRIISDLKEQTAELESEKEDLIDELRDLRRQYSNEHNLGIGDISWSSNSFELSEVFELVCEKVNITSHAKVKSLLNAL